MISNQFDWVPFYKELAQKLLAFKNNRSELVSDVKKIYENTGIQMPTLDKDNTLVDMDPFTFFGLFNKSMMKESNRIAILTSTSNPLQVMNLLLFRPIYASF